MKLADFDSLINDYEAGRLGAGELHRAVLKLLERGAESGELLERARGMQRRGELSPEAFRHVSQILTEPAPPATAEASGQTDETLIMQHPGQRGDRDETLIMPDADRGPDDEAGAAEKAGRARRSSGSRRRRAGAPPVQVGDVLKGRFELIEVIGKGGMGMVFKARDRIKVQARDSNPYVAVKVLSEAFKKHSRSFIALQREASKAQRLAHPNIATVYDFDHDGSAIYMTMELLHGQPFDELIARLPPGGMGATGLRYIEELGGALAYAHKRGLIHCDLKPANIYLCDGGTVKLLDFGITRAVQREQHHDSGDPTLFDPASLNALTPAYASVEMFRGDPPDPRDDVYALACVAYELITGVHPYRKVAAHKAQELGLTPPRAANLTRRQQRAFEKALALERDKRTATVEAFLKDLHKPKSHATQLAFFGGAVLLLSAALLGKTLHTQWREEAQLQLIQTIKDGDRQRLHTLLQTLDQKDEKTRAYLTAVLRREIIMYYQERINAAINAREKRYDFPRAARLLEQVQALYPDSASLSEAEQQLQSRKKALVAALERNYHEQKQHGGETRRILEILAEAAPEHPLLQNGKP